MIKALDRSQRLVSRRQRRYGVSRQYGIGGDCDLVIWEKQEGQQANRLGEGVDARLDQRRSGRELVTLRRQRGFADQASGSYERHQIFGQLMRRKQPNVLSVDCFALLRIETGGARIDPSDVEGLDHLGDCKHVAVLGYAPAEQAQGVCTPFREIALLLILGEAGSLVALG